MGERAECEASALLPHLRYSSNRMGHFFSRQGTAGFSGFIHLPGQPTLGTQLWPSSANLHVKRFWGISSVESEGPCRCPHGLGIPRLSVRTQK